MPPVVVADPLPARWAAPLAAVAGGVIYAAFPPLGQRWCIVPGAALLLLAVRCQRARTGFALGLLAGLAFFVPLLSWLQPSPAGAGAWLALSLLMALFVAGMGAAMALVSRLPGWPLWSATLWVTQEAARARWPFGGFSWGRLAFSQDAGPFTPLAAYGGAALVTFAVALAAGLLVWLGLQLRRARPGRLRLLRLGGAVAAVALLLVGPALLPRVPPGERTVTVAAVQGNVPRQGLAEPAQRRAVLRNHAQATERLAAAVDAGQLTAPDLVLWPENSTDIDPRTDPEVAGLISAAARRVGRPILVGALLDRSDGRVENAGVVWDPVSGFGAHYVKRHPVPFGEYIPLRSLLEPRFGALRLIPRDFVSGPSAGVLTMAGVRLADVICFEVAYDDVVRDAVTGGGELIVVQTNNSTFVRSGETRQQLAMSRFRAVEHARTVVVAATTGISAVITPKGQVVAQSEVFTSDLLVETVALSSRLTVADRVGVLPEAILGLAGLAGLLAVVVAVALRLRDRAGVAA